MFGTKRMKANRNPGISRYRLPGELDWRRPPEPSLERLQAGETQYSLLSPTEVFRIGLKRVFRLALVLVTIVMIVLPLEWLSPGWLALKLMAAFAVWGSALIYVTSSDDWPNSRLGRLFLLLMITAVSAGLLAAPTSASLARKFLALLLLVLLASRHADTRTARATKWLKRHFLKLFESGHENQTNNGLSSAEDGSHADYEDPEYPAFGPRGPELFLRITGYTLKGFVITFCLIVLVFSGPRSSWLLGLVLVSLLVVSVLIYARYDLDMDRINSVFLAGMAWGGLLILVAAPPDQAAILVIKLALLAVVGVWIWYRWSLLKWMSRYQYYTYDLNGWKLYDLERGMIPTSQSFEWSEVSDVQHHALGLVAWALGLTNGSLYLDTKGNAPNIHADNISCVEELHLVILLYREALRTAVDDAAEAVRRKMILDASRDRSVAQLRRIFPGADHQKTIASLVELGELREAPALP